MSTKKALRERARSEAKTKKPGSVLVTFKKPVVSSPFWRGPREDEFQRVFSHSQAHTQGEVVQVSTPTPTGNVVRLFHWSDIGSVIVVPPFAAVEPEED